MAPPSAAFAADTLPPSCSATCRTIARPSPRALLAAAVGAAIEPVEHVGEVLVVDPAAVVADTQSTAVQEHVDDAVRRRMTGGVVKQIVDRAAEPVGGAVDDPGLERCAETHLRVIAPGPRERLLDDAVKPDRLRRAGGQIAAGELDQVTDEPAQLLALLDDVGEQTPTVLLTEFSALEQHLDVRAQARHRRAQLMGCVSDELALRAHRLVELVP